MRESKIERVRKHYNVPAKIGGRILFEHTGRYGTICSVTSGQNLRVRFDGDKKSTLIHATWKIKYI